MNQQIDPKALTGFGAPSAPALQALRDAAIAAGQAVPPAWPLSSSVAVNPFLGQVTLGLAETATLLGKVAGTSILPDRASFAAKIGNGEIKEADLLQARAQATDPDGAALAPAELAAASRRPRSAPKPLPTLAELAAMTSGIDVPALVLDRLSALAGNWFDKGQAGWRLAAPSLYAGWRDWAGADRVPDIAGLPGVREVFSKAPATSEAALHEAAGILGLSEASLPLYFHRLLMSVGGWAQYARGQGWQAEQHGHTDSALTDLLAARLMWEAALLRCTGPSTAALWETARGAYAEPLVPSRDDVVDATLQEAADIAARRRLAAKMAVANDTGTVTRPALQAAFCIDVRSEVFRRALEAQDPRIETIGFAGFFGLAVEHTPFAADQTEALCPVLLTPGVAASSEGSAGAMEAHRLRLRAEGAWARFRSAAVGAFGFVETMGPAYLPKIVADSLGQRRAAVHDHHHPPSFDPALSPEDRITTAEAVLRAMSLTEGFAPIVLLAGHGANVTNNPHAAALDCGACGGHSGEVNARLLAGLLNDPAVRAGLSARGIAVPEDTVFVAALHDTTTDRVALYDAPKSDAAAAARRWLDAAGDATRGERAARLPGASGPALPTRAKDWAQVRPEWGLAGCAAFIAAPRSMTQGRDLAGRAFLHSYEWEADAAQGYSTLELILTAPVVVASWISLQYFGSTTAPDTFGGGNKLLHNVVGGIGVLEGNGGDLRPGLPIQSVHDGTQSMHDPLRLTVAVAAPASAISAVLEKHPEVRALFDNGWLALFTLDADGKFAQRYAGALGWDPVVESGRVAA